MRGPNIQVVFQSPQKNFQELFQLHQTLILAHVTIIAFSTKMCPGFYKKVFAFNFICVLVFFQKYAMTSVHKNPKIYVNVHCFRNRGNTFLPN